MVIYHTEFYEFKKELYRRKWNEELTSFDEGSIDVAILKEFYANLYDPKDKSLKTVPSEVANCRNLPPGGGAKRPLVRVKGASSIEGKRMESPPTFIRGQRRKNLKGDGLHFMKMRVRELFTYRKGISTSRARHKGRQTSIKCANMTSKLYIFLFYVVMYFGGSVLSLIWEIFFAVLWDQYLFIFLFLWLTCFPI